MSTRRVESSGYVAGMRTVGSSRKSRANCWMFRSSRPKSSLAPHRPLKLGHDRRRPVVVKLGHHLGHRGQAGEDVHVNRHLLLDVGVEHLDHHGLAGMEPGPMDLSDRGRGHCLGLELGKKLFDRPAELGFDEFSHRLGRIGVNFLLELLEFLGQPDSDQVGPRAENLAELDERRAELGQGQPQAGLPGMPGNGHTAPRLQQVLGKIRPQPADPRRQFVLAQHRHNLVPAAEVAVDLRDGIELHGTAVGRGRPNFSVSQNVLHVLLTLRVRRNTRRVFLTQSVRSTSAPHIARAFRASATTTLRRPSGKCQ